MLADDDVQSNNAGMIADIVRQAAKRLRHAGYDTTALDAEILMRQVLGLDRTGYFLRRNDVLAPEPAAEFDGFIARRLAGEPVAYITGTREFMALPFMVSPAVLVPRPETELLVEWAVDWLKDRPLSVVLDVGTGSGAIAIALAARTDPLYGHTIIGSDVSADALRIAHRNRTRLSQYGSVRSVHLVRGDLSHWSRGPVDLLLANLPYLRPEQLASNPDLRAEPEGALVAGEDGLALIRRLIADLPRVLSPHGAVGLEIDPSQADAVRELLRRALPHAEITVRSDLAGLSRHVVATQAA
jgi:release factor glutamine methyltransferase